MSESNFGHHGNEGPEPSGIHVVRKDPLPYRKRAHLDWRVWAGLSLMFAAITIYVLSDDLAFLHHP